MALISRAYSTYDEYLRHPKFLQVKKQAFERDDYQCVFCNAPATEAHHLRYPRWGTFDTVDNLISVCHECHCVVEGKES